MNLLTRVYFITVFFLRYLLSRIVFLFFVLSGFSILSFNPLLAEVSGGSGNWNSTSTWRSGTTCGSGTAVTVIPDGSNIIEICTGHTVTIPASFTANQSTPIRISGTLIIAMNGALNITGDSDITIFSGGTLTVNGGGTFAMANRTATNNYTILGTVNINNGANINITHNGSNDMRFFPSTLTTVGNVNLGNINITVAGNSTGTLTVTPNSGSPANFSINNLTINKTNSTGSVLLTRGTNINNLSLNSGNLRLDNVSSNTINNNYTQGAGAILTFNNGRRSIIFNGNTWNVNSGAMITTAMGITSGGLTIGGSSNVNITLPNMFNVNELTINNSNATVTQPATITLNQFSSRGTYNQNNTLTVNITGLAIQNGGTYNQNNTLTINNSFAIQSGGTFNAGAQILNFQNASITNNGSFNRGTSTVNFTTSNGTNRSVAGIWNFFNLTFVNTTMAQTVSFMPGAAGAITVYGTFSAQGAAAASALLTLNSSTIGNEFLLNTQNKGAFNYIRVQDSNAAGSNPGILPLATLSASRIINLGNNNGWFTAPTGQVLRIASAVASDPSGFDNIYNVGDKITVTFSIPTNQKPANLIKTNLDQLFNFSSNIGSDYTGSWASPTSLVINIKNATGATPLVMGRFNISIRPESISPGMDFCPASGTAVLSTLQTFVTGSFSLTQLQLQLQS